MVDHLAQDYAGKPAVFLEYNVNDTSRIGRFYAAYGAGGASYPLVIVDSGHQVQTGVVPFYDKYKSLVDQELIRAPQAQIQATWQRTGNKIAFSIQVTNQSGVSLSTQNTATVHALDYEDSKVGVTSRYVRSVVSQNITTDLAPGASDTFTLETPDLSGVDWNKLHYLALVDYRPGGVDIFNPFFNSPFDMLQAAVALPAVSDNPVD